MGAPKDMSEYMRFDPFSDDRDTVIQLRTIKIVTTRSTHECASPSGKHHTIPAGTRARWEKARIEGMHWGSYWTCLDCIDSFWVECGIS